MTSPMALFEICFLPPMAIPRPVPHDRDGTSHPNAVWGFSRRSCVDYGSRSPGRL
jgi:hypothetical protein